jgi:hypothetical protein
LHRFWRSDKVNVMAKWAAEIASTHKHHTTHPIMPINERTANKAFNFHMIIFS